MPDGLERVKKWLGQITELGLLLVGLFVVLQILFGRDIGFLSADVVGNLISLIQSLGDAGLVGLIAIAVILWLVAKRNVT